MFSFFKLKNDQILLMKLLILALTFILYNSFLIAQDKEVFSLLEEGNIESLDNKIQELELIQHKKATEKAYYGALISKKAGLYKSPKKKLSTFKKGVSYLEEAINKDSTNNEIRFLRYIIQIKSPKFLAYNKNTIEDKLFIEKSKLNKEMKLIIEDFNKTLDQFQINLR